MGGSKETRSGGGEEVDELLAGLSQAKTRDRKCPKQRFVHKKNETAAPRAVHCGTHTATRHTPHTGNRALTYVYFGVMYVRGK